ncbi:MAG: PEGA domain-containing protein [Spirochaetia bacterium]
MHRKGFLLVFLGLILCVSATALDSGLFVETPFPGVKVYIDGSYRGETSEGIAEKNYLRIELVPGEYKVRTEYQSDERIYEPVESVVEVPEDKFNVYKVTFQSTRIRSKSTNETSNVQTIATGIIKVRSTPPGAYITVNGVRIKDSLTDTDLYDVPVGNKTVKVSFASLDPLSVSFFLSKNDEVLVKADFEKKQITVDKEYDINIRTDPDGAEVHVDGKYLGKTPLKTRLSHGSHDLSITRQGFSSVSEIITVNQNDSLEFDLDVRNITLRVIPDQTFNKAVDVVGRDSRGVYQNLPLQDNLGFIPLDTTELVFISGETREALRLPFDPDQVNEELTIEPRFPIRGKTNISIEKIPGYTPPPPEPNYKKTYRYESKNSIGKKLLGFLGYGALGALGGLLMDAVLGSSPELTIGGTIVGGIIGFASTKADRERIRLPENIRHNEKLREEWESKNKKVQEENDRMLNKYLAEINDSRPSLGVRFDEDKKITIPRPSGGWGHYLSPVMAVEVIVSDRTNFKLDNTDASAFVTFNVKMKNDYTFDPEAPVNINIKSPNGIYWTINGDKLEQFWDEKNKTFKIYNLYSLNSPHKITSGIWELSFSDGDTDSDFYQFILPYGETGAAQQIIYSGEGKTGDYPIFPDIRNVNWSLNGGNARVELSLPQSEKSKVRIYFYGEDGSDFKYLGSYGYIDLSKQYSSLKRFDIPLDRARVTSSERKILSHILIMLEREHPAAKIRYVYYTNWIPVRTD